MHMLILIMVAAVCCTTAQVNYLKSDQKLTAESLLQLAAAKNDPAHFNRTLQSICVPRVVGTAGHEKVKDYLVGELRTLGLTVELDTFKQRVPIVGDVRFTNIVGRLDPNADRFLTLACHYDSKYFADIAFLGAIDSAVPCAMMLNVAKTLQTELAAHKAASRSDVSLMLIFFDGEEAFDTWSDTDSLYGSRHLATRLPDVDRIDALVLLDLIGAATPTFYNYFRPTVPLFQRLVEIERGLFAIGQMTGNRYMFRPRHSNSQIGDDHVPFLAEDVPVVHLITQPFPPQWHKVEDDLEHLDAGVMANFNKILRCFTYEYLTASRGTVNFRTFGRR